MTESELAKRLVGSVRHVFEVCVDYDQEPNLGLLVYHKDKFPVEDKGKKEVKIFLFYFGEKIPSNDHAIAEMDKAGFRPAIATELQALGDSHPELVRLSPEVLAMGSVVHNPCGDRGTPSLHPFVNGRIGIHGSFPFADCGWYDCLFAAVCK